MTALKCDICGRFYDLKDVSGKRNHIVFQARSYTNGGYTRTDKNFDLCPDCCENIAEIFHIKEDES